MIKKLIAAVLACFLLCAPLAACGGGDASKGSGEIPPLIALSAEENEALTHKLLEDWYGYLIRCEYLYGDLLWALSYLDAFFENRSWDSLQTARAAMASAMRRAETVRETLLEPKMNPEDYSRLIQAGADVSAVQLAIGGIQTYVVDPVLLVYQNYRSFLNSPGELLFIEYDFNCFKEWARLERKSYEINLHDCAVETNYLLLSLDSETEEARFIEFVKERCPQLSRWMEGAPQTQEELMDLSAELLNGLEAVSNEMSSLLGQLQAGLELNRDAVNSLDIEGGSESLSQFLDDMADGAADLKGFPSALPYPDWWYDSRNEVVSYFWDEAVCGAEGETEPRRFAVPGDAILTPPDTFVMRWADVPLASCLAYIDALEGFQISAGYAKEEEGVFTAYYEVPSGSFVLSWEEEGVSFYPLEGSVCFAPPWYLYLTRRPS